jgi:hypothetical protein
MLEGLEKVDWNKLGGVSATDDVPRLIRNLTSDVPQVWTDAIDNLGEIICHQGTVSEATSHVIPFLIELLSSDIVLSKPDILLTLYTICWVHVEARYDFDRKVGPYRTYIQNTLAAIRDESAVYIALLNEPDRWLRATAAFTLPLLVHNSSRSLTAILSRLKVETDPEVKAALAWGLGDVIADDSIAIIDEKAEALALLRRLVEVGESHQVRFSAAHSLFKGEKANVPPEAVTILLDGIARPDVYSNLPGGAVPVYRASEVFCELEGERRLVAFRKALDVVPEWRHAHRMAMALLDCVLLGATGPLHPLHPHRSNYSAPGMTRYDDDAKEPLKAQNLSSEQKEALRIVVEAEGVWKQPSNLLAVYGLPCSRDEAHQLLKQG